MRDYGTLCPGFWRGQTGKEIRAMGPTAQLVAVYLITAPDSNMIGLYYLPLLLLAHETNCTVEEAQLTLDALAKIEWAYYDLQTETVWVRNMAFYQIAEGVERNDKRWAAIVRELGSYDKSPFFRQFLAVYEVPFHLQGAYEAPLEGDASPSQAPSKGLRRARRKQNQAPPKPLACPSKAPSKGLASPLLAPSEPLPSPLEAPAKPLGSPSEARSKEQRAEAKSKEQGAVTETGGAPPEPPEMPACLLPDFLKKELEALGVSEPHQLNLLEALGQNGLRCALVKLKAKGAGKNPAGLLLTHGPELAREGRAMLGEAAARALAGAPEALKDPRWSPMPAELRDDLEVQTAWATWIKAETAYWDHKQGDSALDFADAEKVARRPLITILAERHPDQAGLRARVEALMKNMAGKGATPQHQHLVAYTLALGLICQVGAAPKAGVAK